MGEDHKRVTMKRPSHWFQTKMNKAAVSAIEKFLSYSTGSQQLYADEPEPPYKRKFHPRWIYNIRQNHSLINNAIEEKVSQTFRRGFDEWEKEWEAKCPNCKEEFGEMTPFEEQYGDIIPEDTEIDLDSPRVCPECGDKVEMMTPNPDRREVAEDFFRLANGREMAAGHLSPCPEADVGQTFLQVCKEVAWDIQSFDDGWMVFDRSYKIDGDGRIIDYKLKGAHRAPPDLMNYVIDEETGKFGNKWWICPKCRSSQAGYTPEEQPQPCSNCGCKTYQAYAYMTEEPRSSDPTQFFIRGEFVHASEYEPSKYYGYSPIITLLDEARSMEHMDSWYRDAYEQRRAPRGALVVRTSNADAMRKWNRGQFEKLNSDPNHIPTLMDDSEGGGSDPIKFETLLESPAEMQQMEMREWIKERISGKYGVTSIMMSGSPENSGLSQSMEVQVSNRSADRLRKIFNNIFLPAFLGQIKTQGWDKTVAEVEEEDEMAEAEQQQRELQIAQQASQLGLEVEWTKDQRADVKAGEVDMGEEGGLEGMLGGGMGDGPEGPDGPDESGGQPQLDGVEQEGGMPSTESRPAEGEPAFGRMSKDLMDGKEIEVFNEWTGEWEKAEMVDKRGSAVIAETESGVQFKIGEGGEVAPAA